MLVQWMHTCSVSLSSSFPLLLISYNHFTLWLFVSISIFEKILSVSNFGGKADRLLLMHSKIMDVVESLTRIIPDVWNHLTLNFPPRNFVSRNDVMHSNICDRLYTWISDQHLIFWFGFWQLFIDENINRLNIFGNFVEIQSNYSLMFLAVVGLTLRTFFIIANHPTLYQ